jgi:hypothetical protein
VNGTDCGLKPAALLSVSIGSQPCTVNGDQGARDVAPVLHSTVCALLIGAEGTACTAITGMFARVSSPELGPAFG